MAKKKQPKNIRAYMSHSIRAEHGNKATLAQMNENCQLAVDFANQLRAYLMDWHRMDGLPLLGLYVPGENDEFVQIAYKRGYLTEEEILEVDCAIIDKCNLLIVYGKYVSGGMKVEIDYCKNNNIPILHFMEYRGNRLPKDYQTALRAAIAFCITE